MATADDRGAGGKITGRRNIARTASPYARPAPPPAESPRRSPPPRWLFSAARTLAAGAGKIFSVFRSDDEGDEYCSSSGSDLSEGETESGSSYTDDGENDGNLCIYPAKGGDDDEMQVDTTTGSDKYALKEIVAPTQRIGSKQLIEQLLLQETFTREECIKLTKMIESRVIDFPASNELLLAGVDERSTGVKSWSSLSSPIIQATTPDIAVNEAKKWFQEKSLASTKTSEFDHGLCSLNSIPYDDLGNEESPVDLAKTYMSSRPRWVSSSLFKTGLGSPPPVSLIDFNDKTPLADHQLENSKLPKQAALTTRPETTTEDHRQVLLKLVDDSPEPLQMSSGVNDPNEDLIILSDDDARIETNGSQDVTLRREGTCGELNTRLPSDNGCKNLIKSCDGVASNGVLENVVKSIDGLACRQNGLGQSISSLGNHTASSPNISEDAPEVHKIDEGDKKADEGSSANQEVAVLHHNGNVLVVEDHERAAIGSQDGEASLTSSLSGGNAAPLNKLHNDGGHVSLSNHSQGALAVSNSRGNDDVVRGVPSHLVGESDAVEFLPPTQKGRVATPVRRNVPRRKAIARIGGQARKK